ncbi:MAG: PQQ-binding-like beta-propeller repeat protein, partial [Acidobacteriota bacterium]
PETRPAVWAVGVPLAMLAVTAVLQVTCWTGSAGRLRWLLPALAGSLLVWIPLRVTGLADGEPAASWRWAASLHRAPSGGGASGVAVGAAVGPSHWPGFRGPGRDGRVPDFDVTLNWRSSPPREAWRVPVGPGWSSFAVAEGRLYTQEQRGDEELVSAFDIDTGEALWRSPYRARFAEMAAGAGPRGTPTLSNGRIYALGATGVLRAVDAATGEGLWHRDLQADFAAPLPGWGFSASPLVVAGGDDAGNDERVVVYAGGPGDDGLLAFHGASGEVAWRVATAGMNFSSPQPVRLGGRDLVLWAERIGVVALDPADGEVVWRFSPSVWGGAPIVQVQRIGLDDLIVPLGDGIGIARIHVEHSAEGEWTVEERWTSRALKPTFNDFVVHDGHLYGFDGSIFACVDGVTGERRWKRGRYGEGQVLLLGGTGQMLVAAENGELVLLRADPDRHREEGRVRVLEEKTWSHPVVVGGRLFLRNAHEAVGLDLVPVRPAD